MRSVSEFMHSSTWKMFHLKHRYLFSPRNSMPTFNALNFERVKITEKNYNLSQRRNSTSFLWKYKILMHKTNWTKDKLMDLTTSYVLSRYVSMCLLKIQVCNIDNDKNLWRFLILLMVCKTSTWKRQERIFICPQTCKVLARQKCDLKRLHDNQYNPFLIFKHLYHYKCYARFDIK